MAKAVRFHIGANGPDICRADPTNPRAKGCPFGGESGTENHFSTMEEAGRVYEQQMESEGSGLMAVATKVRPSTKVKVTPLAVSLATELKGIFKNKFEGLVSDSSYGISKERNGYSAESTEGLERFRSQLMRKTGYEIDPEVQYADDEGEVIQSVYIQELGITIDNDGANEDLKERGWLSDLAAEKGSAYWR